MFKCVSSRGHAAVDVVMTLVFIEGTTQAQTYPVDRHRENYKYQDLSRLTWSHTRTFNMNICLTPYFLLSNIFNIFLLLYILHYYYYYYAFLILIGRHEVIVLVLFFERLISWKISSGPLPYRFLHQDSLLWDR